MGKGDYRLRVGGKGGWGGSGRLYGEAIDKEQEKRFQRQLGYGKNAERVIDIELTALGFHVLDISNKLKANGRYIPFDLLASTPNGSNIIIQVKSTRAITLFYEIYVKDLTQWEDFKVNAEKIIIIVTRNKGYLYIKVSDIRSTGRLINSKYLVLYKDTKPISQLIEYNM